MSIEMRLAEFSSLKAIPSDNDFGHVVAQILEQLDHVLANCWTPSAPQYTHRPHGLAWTEMLERAAPMEHDRTGREGNHE